MSSSISNSNNYIKSKRKRSSPSKKQEISAKKSKNNYFSENESDSDEDISKSAKQENSLGQLTKNFLDYIKKRGRVRININDLVNDLKVKKRRIYDITNVLQGIGYIEKKGKNEILWIKNENTMNIPNSKITVPSESYIANYSKLKSELEELKNQNNLLDDSLNKYREEFKIISEKQEFPEYGYITFKDITDFSLNEKLNFMVIKAPKGTAINVIDDEEAKKAYSKIKIQMDNGKIQKNEKLLNTLENLHHIFFTSNDEKLKIYKIDNGEIKEHFGEENVDINDSLTANNNFLSNNNKVSNINEKEFSEKNKKLNQKQYFTFDNFNDNKISKNKKEESNNYNLGISSIFK